MLPTNDRHFGSTGRSMDSVIPLREGKLPQSLADKGTLLSLLTVADGLDTELAVHRESGEQDEYVERQLSELMNLYVRLVDHTAGQLGRENHDKKLDRRTGTMQGAIDVSETSIAGVDLREFAEQQLQWLRRELALLDQGYAELDRFPGRERDEEISEVKLHVNEMRQGFIRELTNVLGLLVGALQGPIEKQQEYIGELTRVITRYHGDFNDLLLVNALAQLRHVAEKQKGTVQDWFDGCRNIFAYIMNVLYAETEISNDIVKTTKQPFFPQITLEKPLGAVFMSNFEWFLYLQEGVSGKSQSNAYVEKKNLYVSDNGNVYEYGIVYPYRTYFGKPRPLGDASYYIVAYDAKGNVIPRYTIDPQYPVKALGKGFANREAVEDMVIAQCRAWDREREEMRQQERDAKEP